MASSGSIYGSMGNESIRVDWMVTGQDITNNTSTIQCDLHYISDAAEPMRSSTHTITVDGTSYELSSDSFITAGDHYIGSIASIVDHNADGSKSLSISAEFNGDVLIINTHFYYTITASGAIILDTIERKSVPSLSASAANFGDSVMIYTNRLSTSFTHRILVSYGGGADYEEAVDVEDGYSFTVPMHWMNYIPSTTYCYARFTVETYNNGTYIGSNQVQLDVWAQASIIPTITSVTLSDTTSNFATYGGYVQGKSRLNVAVVSAGAYGSTIKTTTIKVNGSIYSNNYPLNTSGTNTITVTVTDTRGRTSSITTKTISVLAYSLPTISSLRAVRCDSNGTENEEGAYIKATFSSSITPLNNHNGKQFHLQSKISTSTSWTNQATYTSSYSWDSYEIFVVDINNMINVRLVATDDFTSTTHEVEVGTAFTLIDFKADGKGIAFGKASTEDGFDVDLDTRFRKDVRSEVDVVAGLGTTNQASLLEVGSAVNSLYCKNILPNNAVSQTINGLTFTVNSDKSVTIDGTCTTAMIYPFYSYEAFYPSDLVKGGTYIASVGASLPQNCYLNVFQYVGGWQSCGGTNPSTFTVNNNITGFIMRFDIVEGVTFDNLTVYPMVRLASIIDDTYEPYKPSLQSQINTNNVNISSITNKLSNGRLSFSWNDSTGTLQVYIDGTYIGAMSLY